MLGNWLSGGALVLAMTAALLLPAGALGEEAQTSLHVFRLRASNGYEFTALAALASEEGEPGWIGLFLVDAHSGVSYTVPAMVTDKSIDADLGKLGKISVTLVPTGRMKTVPVGCKPGARKRVETARYEGTVEFHGEEGFTDVSATSAPFPYGLLSRIRCHPGGDERAASSGSMVSGVRLHAQKDRPDRYRVEFDATQKRPGGKVEVSVEDEEHRGLMEIHRATWTWASAGALRYDDRLRAATIAPPAPFAGHASFRRGGPAVPQWTGNLTADLPGHSNLPVTGPGFSAILEHSRR